MAISFCGSCECKSENLVFVSMKGGKIVSLDRSSLIRISKFSSEYYALINGNLVSIIHHTQEHVFAEKGFFESDNTWPERREA